MASNTSDVPAGCAQHRLDAEKQPASWGGVFAMTLCVFALIASEFMPVMGIAGFIGTVLISPVLKRGFYPTLIAIPLLMAAIAGALMLFGTWSAVTVALLGLWGLVATAAPVGWWVWVPKAFPKDAEAGGGLMVAVIQLSIALGSTLGGVLFDISGYQSAFSASVVLLLIAALLTFLTSRPRLTQGG